MATLAHAPRGPLAPRGGNRTTGRSNLHQGPSRRRPALREGHRAVPLLPVLLLPLVLTSIGITHATAQPIRIEVPADPESLEASAEWLEIGSFRGPRAGSFVERLNNWLFEQQRDTSLYQDLGALKLGLGIDLDTVDVDWDNYFDRRVVQSHGDLEPGSTLTADDLSGYRQVQRAVTRVRFGWNYLRDVVGPVDVGVEVEGGVVLAAARTLPPRAMPDRGRPRAVPGRGFKTFIRERELSPDSDVLDLTATAIGAVSDRLAAAFGAALADTERKRHFFEGYAKPVVLFVDLGAPVRAELFDADDPTLAPGDSVTYTTFLGLSPLRAGFREGGLRVGFKRFYRFLRETTIRKGDNRTVLVRVRDSYSSGNEKIPFRLRPELRLFILKVGYTFLDARRENFDDTESDVTYLIDLATDEGRAALDELLDQSGRVALRPPRRVPAVPAGATLLGSEFRDGRKKENRTEVSLFDWFNFKRTNLGSNQQIRTPDRLMREVVRARTKQMQKTMGRNRDYTVRSIITSQGDVQVKVKVREPDGEGGTDGGDAEPPPPVERDLALTIETSVVARYASGRELHRVAADLDAILGIEGGQPLLRELAAKAVEGTTRLAISLDLSFGWEQIARLAETDEDALWRELAALLLGPEHRLAWSTKEKRFWWMPGERSHGRQPPWEGHISAHYDRLLDPGRATVPAGLGLRPARHDSRSLFIKAAAMVKKFRRLERFGETGECLQCLADMYSRASDVVLLQALLVRFAGGVESGGVGYRLEAFTDDMARPVVADNGIEHGYRYRRGGELVGNVDAIRDADSRLRAGQLLLRSPAGAPAETGEPCWKLRLYSDLLFDDSLELGAQLRADRAGADPAMLAMELEPGTPSPVPQTPFATGRFAYDVALPWIDGLSPAESYTLLLRLRNSAGLPVSEEQVARFTVPAVWPRLAAACGPGLEAPPVPGRRARRAAN